MKEDENGIGNADARNPHPIFDLSLIVAMRVAAIISIVETCRRLQVPVREYLNAVLPGLENSLANRLNELTPAAWFARK